ISWSLYFLPGFVKYCLISWILQFGSKRFQLCILSMQVLPYSKGIFHHYTTERNRL
uniref:Uncharacterized protein n=1 Tax=Aegilops tauschii subsp. strangulata TaxID=200361 RepID=A0A453I321_AEGTS